MEGESAPSETPDLEEEASAISLEDYNWVDLAKCYTSLKLQCS